MRRRSSDASVSNLWVELVEGSETIGDAQTTVAAMATKAERAMVIFILVMKKDDCFGTRGVRGRVFFLEPRKTEEGWLRKKNNVGSWRYLCDRYLQGQLKRLNRCSQLSLALLLFCNRIKHKIGLLSCRIEGQEVSLYWCPECSGRVPRQCTVLDTQKNGYQLILSLFRRKQAPIQFGYPYLKAFFVPKYGVEKHAYRKTF
jgi:hypothetical protein